ncbi:MAG TPA: histidinol dehydrogenase, partial [Bacteroidota bacterium]|nr:histidinol dehydrogenase [Bacteroidota bacterium]
MLTKRFDHVMMEDFSVTDEEFIRAKNITSAITVNALSVAENNIEQFHRAQLPKPVEVQTMRGVVCRREWRPIRRVGLYVPGGSAPLISTVLMLGIPARIAGCQEIILCTPPAESGEIPAALLVAAEMVGIKQVYKIGGAQAIAAMAVGTKTISRVNKIFGPGNQFVSAAKSVVSQPPYNVAIDMLAGPSELLIIADESANPQWVAADLLSQAEHGKDSPVVLVSTASTFVDEVEKWISVQQSSLTRSIMIEESIRNSVALVVEHPDDAIRIANEYAPEHLILAVNDPEKFIAQIHNAGSVFIGHLTSVVFGDYASGTNHTLPTNGSAVSTGGLTVESFMKPISFQSITDEGFQNLAAVV